MPSAADRSSTTIFYDGASAEDLARELRLPRVVVYDEIGSTLDVAHTLAGADSLAGTLILADSQSAGRGRHGRTWTSERGAGIWLTLIERPRDENALAVVSLRIGIALSAALDPFAEDRVQLKWPNDLFVNGRKLGGVLVEARWRDATPEWIAIGVGINVRPPMSEARATGLRGGVSRLDVLRSIVPVMREASERTGALGLEELALFAERDLARGRECVEPVRGVVRGIDSDGALLVDIGTEVVAVRAGSLVLKEEQ